MICGTLGRPCPKLGSARRRGRTNLPRALPHPAALHLCLSGRNSLARQLPRRGSASPREVELLAAFQTAFGGRDEEVNYVDFEVSEQGDELLRRTVIRRAGIVQHASDMTAIQRV